MSLIDLDQAPAEPARPSPASKSGRRAAWSAAGLIVIGAVTGSAVTSHVLSQQRQHADARVVSVLAFAEATSWTPVVNQDGIARSGTGQAHFNGRVVVVNAGPRPIDVRAFSAHADHFVVTSADDHRWIRPGASEPIDVEVTVDCTTNNIGGDVAATVVAVTENQSTARARSIAFDANSWDFALPTALAQCLLESNS